MGFWKSSFPRHLDLDWIYDIERITAKGHDFLDLSRNDTIGTQAKNLFKKKAIDASPQLVLELMTSITRNLIGI